MSNSVKGGKTGERAKRGERREKKLICYVQVFFSRRRRTKVLNTSNLSSSTPSHSSSYLTCTQIRTELRTCSGEVLIFWKSLHFHFLSVLETGKEAFCFCPFFFFTTGESSTLKLRFFRCNLFITL